MYNRLGNSSYKLFKNNIENKPVKIKVSQHFKYFLKHKDIHIIGSLKTAD